MKIVVVVRDNALYDTILKVLHNSDYDRYGRASKGGSKQFAKHGFKFQLGQIKLTLQKSNVVHELDALSGVVILKT